MSSVPENEVIENDRLFVEEFRLSPYFINIIDAIRMGRTEVEINQEIDVFKEKMSKCSLFVENLISSDMPSIEDQNDILEKCKRKLMRMSDLIEKYRTLNLFANSTELVL